MWIKIPMGVISPLDRYSWGELKVEGHCVIHQNCNSWIEVMLRKHRYELIV